MHYDRAPVCEAFATGGFLGVLELLTYKPPPEIRDKCKNLDHDLAWTAIRRADVAVIFVLSLVDDWKIVASACLDVVQRAARFVAPELAADVNVARQFVARSHTEKEMEDILDRLREATPKYIAKYGVKLVDDGTEEMHIEVPKGEFWKAPAVAAVQHALAATAGVSIGTCEDCSRGIIRLAVRLAFESERLRQVCVHELPEALADSNAHEVCSDLLHKGVPAILFERRQINFNIKVEDDDSSKKGPTSWGAN